MSDRARRIQEWDSQLNQLDYEQVLGVSIDAPAETCRLAYYRFAQAFHPDTHIDADPELRAALTRIFQRGVEAYRVLTDPVLRALWSKAKTGGARRLASSTRPPELDVVAELQDLHLRCRSAGAKLCAKQAHSAYSKGNHRACAAHLRAALEYECGANPDIARCLEAIEPGLPWPDASGHGGQG